MATTLQAPTPKPIPQPLSTQTQITKHTAQNFQAFKIPQPLSTAKPTFVPLSENSQSLSPPTQISRSQSKTLQKAPSTLISFLPSFSSSLLRSPISPSTPTSTGPTTSVQKALNESTTAQASTPIPPPQLRILNPSLDLLPQEYYFSSNKKTPNQPEPHPDLDLDLVSPLAFFHRQLQAKMPQKKTHQ